MMLKTQALEKYKEHLRTSKDYMGLSSAALELIETNHLVSFMVSALVQESYQLDAKVKKLEAELSQLKGE